MNLLVDPTGIEPVTSRLRSERSTKTELTAHTKYLMPAEGLEPTKPRRTGDLQSPAIAAMRRRLNGPYRIRTGDLLHAMQALYQKLS